jgi:hypothetical protein
MVEALAASMKNIATQRATTPRRLPFPESPDIERLIHPDAVASLIDTDPILDHPRIERKGKVALGTG